jgi:hypothetical protein
MLKMSCGLRADRIESMAERLRLVFKVFREFFGMSRAKVGGKIRSEGIGEENYRRLAVTVGGKRWRGRRGLRS